MLVLSEQHARWWRRSTGSAINALEFGMIGTARAAQKNLESHPRNFLHLSPSTTGKLPAQSGSPIMTSTHARTGLGTKLACLSLAATVLVFISMLLLTGLHP
jgi:hypothetical protein